MPSTATLGLVARHARLGLRHDAQQIAALESLENLGVHVLNLNGIEPLPTKTSRYLVGSVGSGKSLVMDLFHSELSKALPRSSRRVHFLQFMADSHAQLHAFGKQASARDPFEALAISILNTSPVLCLDEFQIVDIADAMLMRRLFTTLFSFSHTKSPTIPAFTLVTTSNKPIAELYGTGINRQQVKPLLHALETHCETIVMDHSTDYRKLHAQSATTRCFYHPGPTSDYATQQEAHTAFMNRFMTECGETPPQPTRVSLAAGRTLDVPLASPRCAWVPFDLLCGNRGKLGGADYLALCARFPRIFVSGPVPLLDKDGFGDGGVKGVDLGRRFINLVDVAYDSRVGLVVEAVADVESVLRGLREAPNVAPFFQGGGEGEIRVKKEGGSSSSSSTTYVGQMEWSATGLQDASLASIGNVGVTETSFAVDRAASRLIEMGTLVWANK